MARLGIINKSLSMLTVCDIILSPSLTKTRPAIDNGLSSHDAIFIPPYFSVFNLIYEFSTATSGFFFNLNDGESPWVAQILKPV